MVAWLGQRDWFEIILIVCAVTISVFLFLILRVKLKEKKADGAGNQIVETSEPDHGGAQASQMDRQPINHAYEYLTNTGANDGEFDHLEAIRISSTLKQAAYDDGITIWGAIPSTLPSERQNLFLLKIKPDYWKHYEIDVTSLIYNASDLPDRGCKTIAAAAEHKYRELYCHLHVDMNQVKAKWPRM